MQNSNTIATYDYYTLDQARQIIEEENRQKAIKQAKRTIGIIAPFILDGDATISLFAFPIGIFLLLTKERVMIF